MRVEARPGAFSIALQNEKLQLLPEKALYWPRKKSLIISDLHLGKAGHFRKNGLAVPGNVHFGDLRKMDDLIRSYEIARIIFLGDLFHSEMNTEWNVFCDWVGSYPDIQFTLVEGNHDILPRQSYLDLGVDLHEVLTIDGFSFSHEEVLSDSCYNISGHIHPGISLRGKGKQGLRVPCFYFKPTHAYLPAFGFFTGIHPLRKAKGDKVFGVADGQVLSLNLPQ